MRTGELEQKLMDIIPPAAAEAWDRTGMLVGNPEDEVKRVAVALDPTLDAIDFAANHGCNALVTHHPLFLDPPAEIKPSGSTHDAVGARIWRAIEAGISVISFHTALDANPIAAKVLSDPLGIELTGDILEEMPKYPGFGYGRIGVHEPCSLGDIANECVKAFGRHPRVWGSVDSAVSKICCWTGASGDSPRECIERGVDVLICGEVKYHSALDAVEQGLAIIELGHDVSEQVHCGVLIESLQKCGVPHDEIDLMLLPERWR